MNLLMIFIQKPIATTLLAVSIALSGILSYQLLPVAPLPQIEFPTINVQSTFPGASPEIMATSVATPLERQLGRISGVTELTSASSLGTTSIVIQFDLGRDINGAARDVQAAIIAARSELPSNLPSQPTYRIVNPAETPILIIALTSSTHSSGEMYDLASTILQQKISQIDGVGQVMVAGSSLPAVRIDVNPMVLNQYGLSLNDVSNVISNSNVNMPKGQINIDENTFEILTNDQLLKAKDYVSLIIGYNNGAAIRLKDVASIVDSIEDVRNAGIYNGKPAVFLVIYKQPGSNIIQTVDEITNSLSYLRTTIPASIELIKAMDRTVTIRSSLKEVKMTLILAILLVIFVIYKFLGSARAAIVPSIAVPLSLAGTFTIMYFLGYSLDNLSLMSLTIATGFVVDDAVVVVENISRHIEEGKKSIQAAIQGTKEVSFTVVSMSFSLIAVFIPILLMNGIVGRLFREFAVTLSISILVSMFVSLTITPMMSAYLLINSKKSTNEKSLNMIYYFKEKYAKTLKIVLNHSRLTHCATITTILFNVFLFAIVSKGFFPQQDTGRIIATLQAQQNTSFSLLKSKLVSVANIIKNDPGVDGVSGIIGGNSSSTGNSGRFFITLKNLEDRKHQSCDEIINRLRKKLSVIPGATLYMRPAQDLVIGGRQNNALYQYTLSAYDLDVLNIWAPRLLEELSKFPGIADMNSDQLNYGLETFITIDRDAASRLGVSAIAIDNILYNAFGQRQISTTYTYMNQYHVVLSVGEHFWNNPDILDNFYIQSNMNKNIPLGAFSKFNRQSTLLVVNHQGELPAATLSFNLLPGFSLGYAVDKIKSTISKIGLPESSIQGAFQGTAQAFENSLKSEPYLILAAIIAVYIVLGMLYESLIHPLTILSTLPSAGVGALFALIITGGEFNVISLIGILLLIGIVKKNAIMIIDFALYIQRQDKKSATDAVYEAAVLRFRPIMMTTMAALLSALPLAFGHGIGSELRQPMGVAIIGGLILSQIITLYTIPVIYVSFEHLRKWLNDKIHNLLIKRSKNKIIF